jgi:hypothetical protein
LGTFLVRSAIATITSWTDDDYGKSLHRCIDKIVEEFYNLELTGNKQKNKHMYKLNKSLFKNRPEQCAAIKRTKTSMDSLHNEKIKTKYKHIPMITSIQKHFDELKKCKDEDEFENLMIKVRDEEREHEARLQQCAAIKRTKASMNSLHNEKTKTKYKHIPMITSIQKHFDELKKCKDEDEFENLMIKVRNEEKEHEARLKQCAATKKTKTSMNSLNKNTKNKSIHTDDDVNTDDDIDEEEVEKEEETTTEDNTINTNDDTVMLKKDLLEVNPLAMDTREADLDRREADRDRREVDLDRREADRDRREADLDRREADRDRREVDLDRREADLDRREADLDRLKVDRIELELRLKVDRIELELRHKADLADLDRCGVDHNATSTIADEQGEGPLRKRVRLSRLRLHQRW